MRKKTNRQQEIISLLTERPTLRISEIAGHLDVTTETIRRDFRELTEKGLIDRMYGGALLRQGPETNVAQRNELLVEQRTTIARMASHELGEVRAIMLGSGATTVHAARRIAIDYKDITVIAHSFGAAAALADNPTITVLMAPGIYHAGESAMHGVQTIEFLNRFSADWCILGASGIGPEGPCDALIEGSEVYRTMIRRSERCMVLANSSKFNRKFPAQYANWSDVAVLISEQPPEGDLLRAVSTAGSRVVFPHAPTATGPTPSIPVEQTS